MRVSLTPPLCWRKAKDKRSSTIRSGDPDLLTGQWQRKYPVGSGPFTRSPRTRTFPLQSKNGSWLAPGFTHSHQV